MKVLAVLASLIAAAAAQGVYIFRPTNGETFSPGQNVTVSVVRPDTLTGSTELGVGVAIRHCTSDVSCMSADWMGTLLYAGPYNPWFDPSTLNEPNENFTVTIPEDIDAGLATIGVAHASFVGASTAFLTQVLNVTVNIE